MASTRMDVRVDADELAAIDERARACGMTRSAFVRRAAVDGAVSVTRLALTDDERAGIGQLSRRVAKVGGLLNQTAWHMHRCRSRAEMADLAAQAVEACEALSAEMAEAKDLLQKLQEMAKEGGR